MLSLALLLCLAQDPAAVLSQARAAIDAGPVEAKVNLSRSQVLTWESHVAEGTVVLDPSRDALRVDVEVGELRGEQKRRVTLSREGDRYVFVDHGRRIYYEGEGPVLAGLDSRLALDAGQLLPAPPEEVAASGTADLGEPVNLAGVVCLRLDARLADGPTTHRWYLGSADHLPRVWETERDLGRGDSLKKRLTVREIRRRDKGLEPFSIPEGYEQRAPLEWNDPEQRERLEVQSSVTELGPSLEAFREHFNAELGHVRAVGVFAPT